MVLRKRRVFLMSLTIKLLKVRCALCLAALAGSLALTPIIFAQAGKPSDDGKPEGSPSTLSHDLSGVWMQYPDGIVQGVPGMNAVDANVRPPLTPWGQARFDAAKPLVGPRAVAGQENAPILRSDPAGPPKLLNLPIPF